MTPDPLRTSRKVAGTLIWLDQSRAAVLLGFGFHKRFQGKREILGGTVVDGGSD
jgi:hypothetical protein